MNLLNEKGMNFKGLQESIDTGSSGGYLIFHLFDPLAEFKGEMISRSENCRHGGSERERQVGGRPRKLNENNRALALSSTEDKSCPAKDV